MVEASVRFLLHPGRVARPRATDTACARARQKEPCQTSPLSEKCVQHKRERDREGDISISNLSTALSKLREAVKVKKDRYGIDRTEDAVVEWMTTARNTDLFPFRVRRMTTSTASTATVAKSR